MAYGDQKTVFKMIPGLQNADFLKLGSIHRNLFINTPALLGKDLSSKKDPQVYFAGQITGVEGYFESTCIGLLVANKLVSHFKNQTWTPPPRESALGSLLEAITDETKIKHFQPTNINMSLFPRLTESFSDKAERKKAQIKRAQSSFEEWAQAKF
jgi:methylenetetrahydrofolate--tRNA-(uracil-5-)-methyltransferase